MLKACIGLNCARQIDFIDRRSCQLSEVPEEIYRHEATLEELLLDSNAIQELPPKFFRLVNLRKIALCENEIMRLSPMIANFTKLVELDLSKNCLEELPSNIQFCRSLCVLDISCNPLLRIPDCVSSISSLTHLYLNDVALPALPRDLGNLQNLIVLEARENVMRRIPPSIGDLVKLQKLDLGNNEIEDLPPTFGYLEELQELWLDSNCLSLLPESLSRLRNLTVLDVTKNKLERFPNHFSNLVNLVDLHASENCIEALPDNFGLLKNLVQVKLDLNHLIYLPDSIGKLSNVTELFLFENMLESIPSTIFDMPMLEMLNIDRNHLMEIPSTIGKCKSLHVFSVRENELVTLPEEIGQLESLRVLDVCGNHLKYLPLSVSNLQPDAFWISGNQQQPLISLRQEPHPEFPDKKVLVCQHLPQMGPESLEMDYMDNSDLESEESGFTQGNRNNYRNSTRLAVAFDPGTPGLSLDEPGGGKFVRFPTPFRKELKNKHKKPKLDARPRTTVFKKGSMDDLTVHAVDQSNDAPPPTAELQAAPPESGENAKQFKEKEQHWKYKTEATGGFDPSPLLKSYGIQNLSEGYLDELGNDEGQTGNDVESNPEPIQIPPRSKLQTIEVMVELTKDPARGGLGFSIAGGKGSTPAYEDVDESIFITRIIRGGPAEKDGRLRLGDKLLSVNGTDMTDATHMQAVSTLRGTPRKCVLQVSREVLIVLPDSSSYGDDSSLTPPIVNGDIIRQTSIEDVTPVPPVEILPVAEGQSTPTPDANEGVTTEAATGQIIVEAEIYPYLSKEEGEALVLDADETANNDVSEEKEQLLDDIVEEELEEDEEQLLEEMADEMFKDETDSNDEEETEDQRDNYVNIEIAQSLMGGAKAQEEEEKEEEEEEVVQEQVELTSDSGHVTPDGSEELVILDREYPTLGMSIVGGADYVNKIFGTGQPGIYISKISAGGSAAGTGKLKFGDKILQVNGKNMEGLSHDEAVETLISQDGNIELLVRHEQPPKGLMEVQIDKTNSKKLGISIKGGTPGSHGNPLDPSDEGIFISKISPGEAAEKDGRLRVGHRILEVNGLTLLGATHIEAVHALRNIGNLATILVCHGYSFEEYLKHAQTLRVQRPFAGSVDALDQDEWRARKVGASIKRTHSCASADGMKSSNFSEWVTENDNLNEVLQELAQFNLEQTPNDGNTTTATDTGVETADNKLDILAVLDEPVLNMDKVTEEVDKLLESVSDSKTEESTISFPQPRKSRQHSVELAKQRQEGKKEELESIISEVFVELSDVTTSTNSTDGVNALPSSEKTFSTSPVHAPPDTIVTDMSGPHPAATKQRSLSSSGLPAVLVPDIIPARPMSAEGRRKEDAPPIAPKPIALVSPEKLSFRDRLALYENKVEVNRKADARKSWAPDMFPRSGSTSPVYGKWASYSSLGNSPLHKSEAIFSRSTDKENEIKSSKEEASAEVSQMKNETPFVETNESNLSITSDPPLTGSPMSPPFVDDPGISPPPQDDSHDSQNENNFSMMAQTKSPPVVAAMDTLLQSEYS